MIKRMTWKDYELAIHKHFTDAYPNCSIYHNITKIGFMSKQKRQIDIYIEGKIAGISLNIVVDCKYFKKNVDVKDVEAFLSFLRDIKANKGILITNVGFSKAAYNRASNDTDDLELRI